jgi:hypothetical protein
MVCYPPTTIAFNPSLMAAAKRLSNSDLPVPPEYDFQADVTADRKLSAVMCAIARIAKQCGTTFTQQVDIWEEGE